MNLSNRIKSYRLREGLTQEKFSKFLYVTPQAISKWENEQSIPGEDSLKNLSKILNVPLENLLEEKIHKCKYKVKVGDSLYRIAVNNGVTVDYLLRLNNRKNASLCKDEIIYLR